LPIADWLPARFELNYGDVGLVVNRQCYATEFLKIGNRKLAIGIT